MILSPAIPTQAPGPQAAREVRRDSPLRRARTCYGHLAGVAGVELMQALLDRGYLDALPEVPDSHRLYFAPSLVGMDALSKRGVSIPVAKPGKPIAFSCMDWTERRPHLGGAMGRAIVAALVESGSIERRHGSRVVALTGGLDRWLFP